MHLLLFAIVVIAMVYMFIYPSKSDLIPSQTEQLQWREFAEQRNMTKCIAKNMPSQVELEAKVNDKTIFGVLNRIAEKCALFPTIKAQCTNLYETYKNSRQVTNRLVAAPMDMVQVFGVPAASFLTVVYYFYVRNTADEVAEVAITPVQKRQKTDGTIGSPNAHEEPTPPLLTAPSAPPAPTDPPEISLKDMETTVISEFNRTETDGFTIFEVLVDPSFIKATPEDKERMPKDEDGNIIIRLHRATKTFLKNEKVKSNFKKYYIFYPADDPNKLFFDFWKKGNGMYKYFKKAKLVEYFKGAEQVPEVGSKRSRGVGARLASAAPAVTPARRTPHLLPTPYVLYL